MKSNRLWYSLTKVAFGSTAANLHSLFRGRKFLKLLKRLTVGQAVAEIPLSVGSQNYFSELLSLPYFRILPHTLTHLSAYAYCRVLYVYIILAIYHVHDRGPEGFALVYLESGSEPN